MRSNKTILTVLVLMLVLAAAAACSQDRRGVIDRTQTVTVGEPAWGTSCTPTMVDTTEPEIAALYEQARRHDAIAWAGPMTTRYERQDGNKVKITSIAFEVEGAPDTATGELFAAGTLTCTSSCEAGGHCNLTGCDPKPDKSGCTPCACSLKADKDCEDDGCVCEKSVTAGTAALE